MVHIHVCRILILSPSHSGPPLSGGNLRGGGEGDLQDLSGVLEPPGCRTVPGKPILHFPLPSPPIAAKHSSTKTTLPPSAVQGACPVNPSVCLSVCVLHACVCARRKVYTIPEPHLSDLILCKAAHCAGLHSFFFQYQGLISCSMNENINFLETVSHCGLVFHMTPYNSIYKH